MENLSSNLYDAGDVEIVFQAIDLLYVVAEHEDVAEMLFLLSQKETEHLMSMEGLFNTRLDDGIVILPALTQDYDAFIDKTEFLKKKIGNELWRRQREDPFLKNYMQRSKDEVVTILPSEKKISD